MGNTSVVLPSLLAAIAVCTPSTMHAQMQHTLYHACKARPADYLTATTTPPCEHLACKGRPGTAHVRILQGMGFDVHCSIFFAGGAACSMWIQVCIQGHLDQTTNTSTQHG